MGRGVASGDITLSKVYLAGPMTGLPDFNRAEFLAAAERLRSWGHEVHSPVEADIEVYGTWEAAIARPWQEHLARDIAIVPTCEIIALMRGWEKSGGATLELHIAKSFKMDVISADDGLPLYDLDWGKENTVPAPSEAMVAISRGEKVPQSTQSDYPPRGVGPATPVGVCRNDEGHDPCCPFFHGLPPELLDSLADEDVARNQAELGRQAFQVQLEKIVGAMHPSDYGLPSDTKFEFFEDNPNRQTQVTGGMKDDKGKSRLDLIPTAPLVAVGHVLAFGARKYKPHNWRLGLKWSDTLASALRHLAAWNDGEKTDPETGLSHLDHALCQLMFLSEYEKKGTGINDTWSQTTAQSKDAA